MEYYDTDSIHYNFEKFKVDADTYKVVRATAKEIQQMKLYLNSLYGTMDSCIHFTDEKENNMNKDYIVIHEKSVNGDIRVGIIFPSKIAGIIKGETGNSIILLDSGYNYYCEDKYEDIVKQLV